MSTLADALDVDLSRLAPKKSAADKARLAAMMTPVTAASNAWFAQWLPMGVPGNVTRHVRRARLCGGVSPTDLRTVVSRIHK